MSAFMAMYEGDTMKHCGREMVREDDGALSCKVCGGGSLYVRDPKEDIFQENWLYNYKMRIKGETR